MYAKRENDLRNKELQEGQYGECLREASGRDSSKGGNGRISVKFIGRTGEKEKDEWNGVEKEGVIELAGTKISTAEEGCTVFDKTVKEGDNRETDQQPKNPSVLASPQYSVGLEVGGLSEGKRDQEHRVQSQLMEEDRKSCDKENLFASDSLVLIDIPVVNGNERRPLESLINMDNCQGSIASEHGGRKWKRMVNKKGEPKRMSHQKRDHGTSEGAKRT